MTPPTAADWLGLLLVTESNQPHEWRPIAQVVQNRMQHPRWPDTLERVILEPWQFSHFNPYQDSGLRGRELYEAVVEGEKARPIHRGWLEKGVECACWILTREPWEAPFGPGVLFYYSPVSREPQGEQPWWWEEEVGREFTPSGIDPWRFVFGELA